MAVSGRIWTCTLVFKSWNKHCIAIRDSFSMDDCIKIKILDEFIMDVVCSKLNSLDLIHSIYTLAAIILQLVTMGCSNSYVGDLSMW